MTRFVVTGTDTGIGKTVFSAALAGALGEILIRCNNVMYMRQSPAGGLAAMEE